MTRLRKVCVRRMWFVDLAGSERASDSKEPDKQSRMEGAEINQSLLAVSHTHILTHSEVPHKFKDIYECLTGFLSYQPNFIYLFIYLFIFVISLKNVSGPLIRSNRIHRSDKANLLRY